MEGKIKEGEIVEEEAVDSTLPETAEVVPEATDAVANPMTEEEKAQAEKDSEYRKQISQLVKKVFDDNFANSDLPFAYIEIMPDYFKALISIIKGKSKKWDTIKKLEDDFYMTPIGQLELYEENTEGDKNLDGEGAV